MHTGNKSVRWHMTIPESSVKLVATVCIAFAVSCDPELPIDPITPDPQASFLAFNASSQTLPTSINAGNNRIAMEVAHGADITSIKPEFDVPQGYQVLVGSEVQQSGVSTVNFSAPVQYRVKNMETGQITPWEVHVVPLSCKILVDASHDGGVWWSPQGDGGTFDQNKHHQGRAFAELLRQKGFVVDELGRDVELTDEMFFGYYIVIRANGWNPYSAKELAVYDRLLERGMNLAFFEDHMKLDPADELADHLGLHFKGVADGMITDLVPHELTEGITQLDYAVGSVLVNDADPNIEVLGRLRTTDYGDLNSNGIKDADEPFAPAVMGILHYPNSRIFFMGDTNTFEFQPQPFVDNLVRWMGKCD
jgi:hypothetical protein